MVLVIVAAALAAGASPYTLARSSNCAPPDALLTADRPRQGAHPLGQEPAANQVMTVARRIGNCTAPLIVKTGIGNRPGR